MVDLPYMAALRGIIPQPAPDEEGQTVIRHQDPVTKEWQWIKQRGDATEPDAIPNDLYVNRASAVTGDGTVGFPFKTVTEAVAAVVASGLTTGNVIHIAPGDYSGEPDIGWTDKRIAFVGTGQNYQTVLPKLRPQTTGAMNFFVDACSVTIDPVNAVNVVMRNAAVDAQGSSDSNYLGFGSPATASFQNSTGGLAVSGAVLFGISVGAATINGAAVYSECELLGDQSFGLAAKLTQCEGGSVNVSFPSAQTLNIDVRTLKTLGTLTNCTVSLVDRQQNSKYVYWDASTGLPTSHQCGAADAPFRVLQDAVTACGATGGVIIAVGQGDATQDFLFDGAGVNNTLEIVSSRGNCCKSPVQIGTATLQDHCHVTTQGCAFVGVLGSNSRIWASNCNFGFLNMTAGHALLTAAQPAARLDSSTPWSCGNVDCTNGGTFAAFGYRLAGNLSIGGTSASTENAIRQCDFVGSGLALFVANSGTVIDIDRFSLERARATGYDLSTHNTGSFILEDAPLTKGLAFTVPAIASLGFADVTVSLTGTRPNDTFSFAPNAAAILANVAPMALWSASNDHVTCRFFGVTAGGSYELDVNVNVNSGA